MNKMLLQDEEEFSVWKNSFTGKGICWSEEEPDSYPCIIVWIEEDIPNSMSYGSGIESEFVYPDDFEE